MDGWSEEEEGEGEEGCVGVSARSQKDMKECQWRERCGSFRQKASRKKDNCLKQNMRSLKLFLLVISCPVLVFVASVHRRNSLTFVFGELKSGSFWLGQISHAVSYCTHRQEDCSFFYLSSRSPSL